MTEAAPKRLRMFAGPNGSGKTSLIYDLAREFSPTGLFSLHTYINADDLLRDLQSDAGIHLSALGVSLTTEELRSSLLRVGRLVPQHLFLHSFQSTGSVISAPPDHCDSYVAAAIADVLRDLFLDAGRSFSFETVMSHESKVQFLARSQAAGYRNYLYFISTDRPEVNVSRIATRTSTGGHDVPADKVIARYLRSLQLVGAALAHSHRGFLFDNSGTEPVWLAERTPEGRLDLKVPTSTLPTWFQTWVAPHNIIHPR